MKRLITFPQEALFTSLVVAWTDSKITPKIMLTLAFPSKVSHIKILAENRDSNLKERVQWWLSWWFLILQVIRMYKLYCLAKFFLVPDSLETVESDLWKPVVGVEGSFKDKESFLLGVLPKLQKNREITLIVKSWNTTCYIKSRPFEMHVQCRYEIYTKACIALKYSQKLWVYLFSKFNVNSATGESTALGATSSEFFLRGISNSR